MSSILAFLLISAVGAAAWYLFLRKNDDSDNATPPTPTNNTPTTTPSDTPEVSEWSK